MFSDEECECVCMCLCLCVYVCMCMCVYLERQMYMFGNHRVIQPNVDIQNGYEVQINQNSTHAYLFYIHLVCRDLSMTRRREGRVQNFRLNDFNCQWFAQSASNTCCSTNKMMFYRKFQISITKPFSKAILVIDSRLIFIVFF